MPAATGAATLPQAWDELQAALDQRQPVQVGYHGRARLICPHALGWRNHRALVLGYQIGGETTTGTLDPDPRKRWRCMFVDEIEHIEADHTSAWQTPHNYNPARPFNGTIDISRAIDNNMPTQTPPPRG